jgi:hypothetical protein
MRPTIRWSLWAPAFTVLAIAPCRAQAPASIASYEIGGTHLAVDAVPDSGVLVTMSRDSASGAVLFAPASVVEWSDSLGAAAGSPTHEPSTTQWFHFGGVMRSTNGRYGLGVVRSFGKDAGVFRLTFAADEHSDPITVDLNWKQLKHFLGLMLFAASRVDSFAVFAPDHVYYELGVTTPVTAKRDNPIPRWPAHFVGTSIEASVLVQFVVDTAGRPVMSSYTLLATSNMAFADEVRRVLPSYRFNPAELDGHLVAQWAALPFVFKAAR